MKQPRPATSLHALIQPRLPETSLIICSRNRQKMLAEAVDSILQGDDVPTELIIIDQSDTAYPALASLTSERTCEIHYVWSQSVGLSRANNYGIATAQYDLLVFTHDDVVVTPTWFGSLIRSLVKVGPRAVITGRVLPTTEPIPGSFAPSTKADDVSATYEGRIGVDVLFPMSMALYRSAFNEIGYFDERLGPGTPFPAAEDNDLGFRLLEAGYRIIYVPEAILYHRAWRTEKDYIPLRWNYGRGQGGYYGKHLSLRDRYMLHRLVSDIRQYTLRFFLSLWRQRRLAHGDVIFLLGILVGAGKWFLTQRRHTHPSMCASRRSEPLRTRR